MQSDQSIGFFMIRVFTESYFRTDYSIVQVFSKIYLFLKSKLMLVPGRYSNLSEKSSIGLNFM